MKKTAIGLISTVAMVSMLSAAEQPKEAQIAELASKYKGIVELDVKLGQKVKKGELVFHLNQDINNAKIEWYKNDTETLNPIMAAAEKLIKTNHISRELYELAIHSDKELKIEEELLNAEIAASKYYSPIDGTVTKIYRYDGSGIGDNDPEVEITEGDVKVNTANQVAMVCMGGKDPSILDLKVQLGQKVKKGDLLFSQKDIDLQTLQLKKDENNFEKAKLKYERQSKLFVLNATSMYDMLISKFDYNRTQADVAMDKFRVAQASFYAPFDGTITKVYRCDGTGIGAGKPVLEITASK